MVQSHQLGRATLTFEGCVGFVLVFEGGAKINAAALEAGVVDKVLLMTAPMFLGGDGARSFLDGSMQSSLANQIALTDVRIRPIGRDFIIEGSPSRNTTSLARDCM